MNVNEMVRELEVIYDDDHCEAGRVEAVRKGDRYGFYLFDGDTEGQLLCSDLTCRMFIELENADIDDKDRLYEAIQDEAMSHGFEPTREDVKYTITFTRNDIRRRAARYGCHPSDAQCNSIASYIMDDMFDQFEHYAECGMLGEKEETDE